LALSPVTIVALRYAGGEARLASLHGEISQQLNATIKKEKANA